MSTRARRRGGSGRARPAGRLARALRSAMVVIVLSFGALQLGQPAAAERAVTRVTDVTSRVVIAAVTRLADALTDVLTDAMKLDDTVDTTSPGGPTVPPPSGPGRSTSTGDKAHRDESGGR
jgi:hypothetical protein